MPRRTSDTGTETTPHFDGKRDRVIKDAKGEQIGITTDTKEIANPSEALAFKQEAMKRDEKR